MSVTKSYFSLKEAAELLGVSRITVFRWVKSGKLKATKVGRSFVVSAEDMPLLLGTDLSAEKKFEIQKVVKQALAEYGETFRALAKE